jgi:hypothetical protein
MIFPPDEQGKSETTGLLLAAKSINKIDRGKWAEFGIISLFNRK